jgi:hypothetical protein
MKPRLSQRVFPAILVVVLLLTDLSAPIPGSRIKEAEAGLFGLNVLVGIGNLVSAANRRTRFYNEARATQKEMNEYYDSLIATARSQLQERELMGQLNRGQLNIYVKMVKALEAERAAVTSQIEAEKNKARQKFNQTLGHEVQRFLLRSPGGQRILQSVRDTLGGLREATLAVQAALDAGRPNSVIHALVDQYTEKMNLLPGIQNEVRNLGSSLGSKLDQALGGVLAQAEAAINDLVGEMGQAVDKVDELDILVASAQNQERTPVSLVEEGGLLGNIHGVDRVNAGFDAAVQAYTNSAILAGVISGSGSSQGNLRDMIRQQLLEQHTDGLAQAGQNSIFVTCTGVGEAQYQLAAAQLGITPVKPRDPEKATYIVCLDNETGLPVHAALIGLPAEETEAEEEPTAEAEETSIPVGNYVGTTGLPDIWAEGKPGHTVVNTIEVNVAENGMVTGEMNVVWDGDPDPRPKTNYPNCAHVSNYWVAGSVSGRLTDMVGALTLRLDYHYDAHFPNCVDPDPISIDSPIDWTVKVSVSGDRMTGQAGDFSFEATRR